MKTHELKILPQYFQAVWYGTKTFELRKDDRDYQRGDILVLKEWDGEKYTGSAICVKVAYILQDAEKYGLKDGYIIMGIRRIGSSADFKPNTNADKFRVMSVEEMAKTIASFRCPHDSCYAEEADCTVCWLDWLKQEVTTNSTT